MYLIYNQAFQILASSNPHSVNYKLKILVTGTAGFIGFHLAQRLLEAGHEVIGLDNINAYYDVQLKLDRLKETGISSGDVWYNRMIHSRRYHNYRFIQLHLEDTNNMEHLFAANHFDAVCHLAAQAGVRYSIESPQTYIGSNINGFFNILEYCRQYPVGHLVYASSSSVYGNNAKAPFVETDPTDAPVSLYAATKKSNELMAHTYSHLFQMPTTGLRFFTVYGPWGRPDMAYFKFTKAILEDMPIQLYNEGNLSRDFTYIADAVSGIEAALQRSNDAPLYQIFNVGNHTPVSLGDFVATIEATLGKKALKQLMPMQPGDVLATHADVSALEAAYGYTPNTPLADGIARFVAWYRAYHAAHQ